MLVHRIHPKSIASRTIPVRSPCPLPAETYTERVTEFVATDPLLFIRGEDARAHALLRRFSDDYWDRIVLAPTTEDDEGASGYWLTFVRQGIVSKRWIADLTVLEELPDELLQQIDQNARHGCDASQRFRQRLPRFGFP